LLKKATTPTTVPSYVQSKAAINLCNQEVWKQALSKLNNDNSKVAMITHVESKAFKVFG